MLDDCSCVCLCCINCLISVKYQWLPKERQAPEANNKMKNELLQVGFEPATLCIPDRCSYQMSYMYMQVVLLNFFKHLMPFLLSFHLKSLVFGKLVWWRASYLALHSSLLGPDAATVNYDYIVINSINCLLIGWRCIIISSMVHTLTGQSGPCFQNNLNTDLIRSIIYSYHSLDFSNFISYIAKPLIHLLYMYICIHVVY